MRKSQAALAVAQDIGRKAGERVCSGDLFRQRAHDVLRDREAAVVERFAAALLAGVTVAYALSPIDLIPDFIPVLGYLDDLIILPAFIALTIHFIPKDLFEHYRREAEGMWADGKPRKWIYALPVIIIWLLLLWLIIKIIFF